MVERRMGACTTHAARAAGESPAVSPLDAIGCAFAWTFLASLGAVSPAWASPPQDGRDDETQQFIVRFAEGSAERHDPVARQHALDAAGRGQGLKVGHFRKMMLGADVIRIDHRINGDEAKEFVNRLRANPHVVHAMVDRLSQPIFDPTDPFYSSQWNYKAIAGGLNLPLAWNYGSGTGQYIAILDTGITNHPDLVGKLAAGYDFVSNIASARDFDGRDANPRDEGTWRDANSCPGQEPEVANSDWHGTFVAGLAAAAANNGVGIAGVAYGARIIPIRVVGACGAAVSDIADAIFWASGGIPTRAGSPSVAIAHKADVINLSLGDLGSCDPETQLSINAAIVNGSTVVAGAGNLAVDAGTEYPANCLHVITVAATNQQGKPAGYSNFGSTVDVAAPGGDAYDILSTVNKGTNYPTTVYGYSSNQGTSVAAPQVAGIAALVQARSIERTQSRLLPAQIESLLKLTARPATCPKGCGAGIVDAYAAVSKISQEWISISDGSDIELDHREGNSGSHMTRFEVSLTHPVPLPVDFRISTRDDTAIAGQDYAPLSILGRIPAGQTSASYYVTVYSDTAGESNERYFAELSEIKGAMPLQTHGVGWINDDDYIAIGNFGSARLQNQATGTRRYIVSRYVTPGSTDLFVEAKGAPDGDADIYVRHGQPPTFTEYDCKSVTRRVSGDNYELCQPPTVLAGDYYVMVNAYQGFSDLTVTLGYNGGPPIVLNLGDANIVEGDLETQYMVFTPTMSYPHSSNRTFRVKTSHGTADADDYEAVDALYFIRGDETSTTFRVPVKADLTVEPTEYFNVTLSDFDGGVIGDGNAFGYIVNDDGSTLSINDVTTAEGDAGKDKTMTFLVSLSKASDKDVSYSIATADSTAKQPGDYSVLSLTGQTIPAGQLAKTHVVTIHGDAETEPTEAFQVNLRQPLNASIRDGQGIGYIINDDGPTLSVLDASAAEGNSNSSPKLMNVTVKLSEKVSVPVTYTIGTVTSAAQFPANSLDYTGTKLTGQVIPAGQTEKVHQIPITADTTVEENEEFLVNLSDATGVSILDRQGTATIYNDDGPRLSVNNVTMSEGTGVEKVATFTVTLSQAATVPITYDIRTGPGGSPSATEEGDYYKRSLVSETIPAGETQRDFAVTLIGDADVEPTETFRVTLSNVSSGATLFQYIGTGTITNDD